MTLRAYPPRGEHLARGTDWLEAIWLEANEAPAFVWHVQRENASFRAERPYGGLKESNQIQNVFDNIARDQNIECSIKRRRRRGMERTVPPYKIRVLDFGGIDARMNPVFFSISSSRDA